MLRRLFCEEWNMIRGTGQSGRSREVFPPLQLEGWAANRGEGMTTPTELVEHLCHAG